MVDHLPECWNHHSCESDGDRADSAAADVGGGGEGGQGDQAL